MHIVFTYFASFASYEDDILENSSNLHVQESKFGKKNYMFGGKSFKKLNSTEFMEFVFLQVSAPPDTWICTYGTWIVEATFLPDLLTGVYFSTTDYYK